MVQWRFSDTALLSRHEMQAAEQPAERGGRSRSSSASRADGANRVIQVTRGVCRLNGSFGDLGIRIAID